MASIRAKARPPAKTSAKTSSKTSAKVAPKSTGFKAVAIVYRLSTDSAVRHARDLAKWLKSMGYRSFTGPEQEKIVGTQAMKSAKDYDQIDLVVVLGGDGTYLRAVRSLEGRQIPILAFNIGSLGFLTVNPAKKIRPLVQKTLSGKMLMQPRTMIHALVTNGTRVRGEFHALNDIVLERGSYPHLINASIQLANRKVFDLKADGFIISSPTGSTAYNLAAGGPILHPIVRAFAITPVAPHALTTRPLVVPDDIEIRFTLAEGSEQKGFFIVDGQKRLEIDSTDRVLIRKSNYDHWVVRESNFNYFHLLTEKLKFGDRA